ncbi:MAG: CoA transferase [Proteobacteria bacterium]|nr:CoA transferase [Pseudomonadota bacterium]
MNNRKPHMLSGYRVLDLTRAAAGPTCTRMFAEMGADVIKVESAPDGEMSRAMSRIRNDRSLYTIQQCLNKRSLCMDLRNPESIALLKELVPHCDIVVENFKPGVIKTMGLGYEVLKSLREDIILCSISALGQTGTLAHKPGYDYIAQAYSGITSMVGDPDGLPDLTLAAIGDVSTGVTAAFAIAAALLDRHRSGAGQHLDIAILDCYYHYHEVNVHRFSASGGAIQPTRTGRHMNYICPGGIFQGNGGGIMIMAFLHHFKDLAAAMGRPELATTPGWENDIARLERRDEVIGVIEAWLATLPSVDAAIEILERHNVPCAPILSVADTVSHPHLVARGTVRTVNDRIAGEFQIPGHPIHSNRYPANDPDLVAPMLGEHNREVLMEVLGKDAATVDALEAKGVLQSKPY